MLIFDQLNKGDGSLRSLAWGVLLGVALLIGQLWRIQVISADRYRASLQTQSFKSVRVPALRGRILDHNRRELVGNTPRYRLDLYLDELRPQFEMEYVRLKREWIAAKQAAVPNVDNSRWTALWNKLRHRNKAVRLKSSELESLQRRARFSVVSNTVAAVGLRLGTKLSLSEEALQSHYLNRRFLPLQVIADCNPTQVAQITEQAWGMPGVALEEVAVRSYPHGSLAVHVLGYLTRDDNPNEDREEITYHYRLPDYVGAVGLEKSLDSELRGTAGTKAIQVNSQGYRHRQSEELQTAPQPGRNVVTTLDMPLQLAVEKALNTAKGGDERGAAIVLNPTNGDILAMASVPSFDPTEFLSPISFARWESFHNKEPERPMFNRASYGEYAPGSTFKVIHALAELENGLNIDAIYTVQPHPSKPGRGAYFLGNRIIEDTARPGEYDFRRAFIKSSNSYFIHFGLQLGWEKLLGMGHRFGLGEKTGVGIGEEKAGDFPLMEDIPRKGWNQGNLANVSIGQEITVTPLQMAVAIGAVANGGKVYYPRLVHRIEPYDLFSDGAPEGVIAGQIRSEIRLPQRYYDLVRASMRDDVLDDEGTGKAARLPDMSVCGKTGTAEIKGNGRKDKVTWFVSFAPFEAPRYVVIVMIESGGSGGGTCAPVARQIYRHLKDAELSAGRGFAGD